MLNADVFNSVVLAESNEVLCVASGVLGHPLAKFMVFHETIHWRRRKYIAISVRIQAKDHVSAQAKKETTHRFGGLMENHSALRI